MAENIEIRRPGNDILNPFLRPLLCALTRCLAKLRAIAAYTYIGTHVAIANKVPTAADDWLALDAQILYRAKVSLS